MIFDGSTKLGPATVSENNWTFEDARSLSHNQIIDYKALIVDAAGNQSLPSSSIRVKIDTAAPNPPSLQLGTGIADGATTAEAVQTSGVVTVQAENGSTIESPLQTIVIQLLN